MTSGTVIPIDPARGASDGALRTDTSRPVDDRHFAWIVLGLFALCVALLTALHEPWADETQTWRLAIDSGGLAGLIRNSSYEGHPLLFHLVLQAVGAVSRSWWAAAGMHALIACGIAWIVLRFAPFTRLEKALIVAGYYVVYEYAVIVRPYGLGMLLAFGACAAWSADRRRPVLAASLLFLLANTSVLGLLLALAAAAAFAIDWWWGGTARPVITRRSLVIAALCIAALAGTVWLVAVQVVPPQDASFKGRGATTRSLPIWDIAVGLTTPLRAMTPIAVIGEGTVQWNNWIFNPMSRAALGLQLLLTGVVLLVGCAIAARRATALLFFLGGTLGYVVFFELFFAGHARHHGHLVMVWIISAWLSRRGPATRWPSFARPLADRATRLAVPLFAISLVPMVIAGAEFAAGDAVGQFTDSRRVAQFLQQRSLADGPILAITRPDAQSVAALLDRPMVFAYKGTEHTFVPWGDTRLGTPEEIVTVSDSLLRSACRVAVIATTHEDAPLPVRESMPVIYETPTRPMSQRRFRIRLKSAPPSARCPAAPPA
jgi:hypothetical protein